MNSTSSPSRFDAYNHIRDLAKSRIIDIENQLKQKGLYTRCGMELEFFIHDDKKHMQEIPPELFSALEKKLQKSRYVERLYPEHVTNNTVRNGVTALGLAIPLLLGGTPSESLGLGAIALAGGQGIQWHREGTWRKVKQYEIVLGNERQQERNHPKPHRHEMGCFKGAVAAEHMKHVVTEELRSLGDVTFQARPRKDKIVSGLHINVSLTDKYGKNLFALASEHRFNPPKLLKDVSDHLQLLQQEGALLFLPGSNSLERLKHGRSSPKSIRDGDMKVAGLHNPSVLRRVPNLAADMATGRDTQPQNTRIENRLPGADADPYLAMLLTVGAMLNAVEGKELAEFDRKIPKTVEAMKNNFHKSKALKDIIGTELFNAIDQYTKQYGDLTPPAELTADPLSKALHKASQWER